MKFKNLMLSIVILFVSSVLFGKTTFRVLFVNDNSVYAYNTDTVLTALSHTGYEYTVFNAVDSLRSPTLAEMSGYNLVMWDCSTDGVGRYLWSGNDTDNLDLIAYLESGGYLWVMGNDFMYDRYTTPQTFAPGDFAYDYLGIGEYNAQSYADDGGIGVPELDLASPGYSSVQVIRWIFASAWWVDACIPADGSSSIYNMGPDGYALAGKSSAIQFASQGHLALSLFFDPAIIDTYENRLQLFKDILLHFQLFSSLPAYSGLKDKLNISPNPARDDIRLTLPENWSSASAEIKIVDLAGRCILDQQQEVVGKEACLNIQSVPRGSYILNLSDNKNSIFNKLIINR
jgi:hypothetical protein